MVEHLPSKSQALGSIHQHHVDKKERKEGKKVGNAVNKAFLKERKCMHWPGLSETSNKSLCSCPDSHNRHLGT